MKSKKIKYIALALLISVTAVFTQINRVSAFDTSDMALTYNAENRAKAKAYYTGLVYCSWRGNDVDDFSIYWMLNGAFAGKESGNNDTGNNITDDYLEYLRGYKNDNVDCSHGTLIKDAFNIFAEITGGPTWDGLSLDEKKQLFCGTTSTGLTDHHGWFHAVFDSRGPNDWNRDCVGDINYVVEANSPNTTDYAFVHNSGDDAKNGIDHMRRFVDDHYFHGQLDLTAAYTDDERYYLHKGLLFGYCSDTNPVITLSNPGDDSGHTSFVDLELGEKELNLVTKYVNVENKHINADWFEVKDSGRDTKEKDADCNEEAHYAIDANNDAAVAGAKNSLVEYLKLDCKKAYTDFYAEQQTYRQSLTEADVNGGKASYVSWFESLPETPDDASCYVTQDTNPVFRCTVDDYINGFLATNPDPSAPGYSGYAVTTPSVETPGDSGSAGARDPDCYSNAGALGWVLCPIINQGGDFVITMYEKIIEPFLVLDSGLFDASNRVGGVATYSAWTQFQTYANIAFIIVFLVVLFSQITGFGIDNYGIKKILPKLIIAAILINMSYVICQVAVDAANVVGYGVKSIFDTVGKINSYDSIQLAETQGLSSGVANAGVATTILVALIIIITGAAILSQGMAILVPVFMAIIGVIIAIFTLFCLLAVRKALAVVLVVVSPVGFLCYMLPNTKKIFDKWLTAFKATLIAFPICSGMVYGGQAVARILVLGAGSSNLPFLIALSAAVMSVAPIFMIPGVLKKSMGGISRFINGFQGRANKFAQRRAGESRAMRYMKHQGEQRMMARQGEYNNRRAQRTIARMDNKMANGKKLSSAQQREYMNAHGMRAAHEGEQQRAYALSFQDKSPEQVADSFTKMAQSGKYDANLAQAAVQKLADSGQHELLNKTLDTMSPQMLANMSVQDKQKLGTQLAGLKKDNIAAGLYGKRLAASGTGSDSYDRNLSSYMTAGGDRGFNSDVARAGQNVIASQDDSTLKYIAGFNNDADGNPTGDNVHFSDEQMRNSIGNLDTKQQEAMNGMWQSMSDERKGEVLAGTSTQQYAKIDQSLKDKIGGDVVDNSTEAQRVALASEENANIRANQTAEQKAVSSWDSTSASVKTEAINKHWGTLTREEQYEFRKTVPKKPGEDNVAHIARVRAEAAKKGGGWH
ncbi:MAG: hypothetical protein MJ154_02520 [Candidatus Saccharibacteria bacterium]|nr:hypothetical protein [Candidatus Saccharibacteria bacterium]